MTDELMSLEDLKNQTLQKHNDDDFNALAVGGFLPRLQLMTANSEKCKEGLFPTNNYALVVDQDYKDLGSSVDVMILAWRPKAMEIGESIISSFDRESDTFKEIQRKSEDSDSGCMWGYEFLVWVPSHKVFATFFCGSKTARREAPNVKARMHKAATLSSKKITKGKYTWFGPKTSDCSTPFDLFPKGQFESVLEDFNNPKESTVELASAEEAEARPQ